MARIAGIELKEKNLQSNASTEITGQVMYIGGNDEEDNSILSESVSVCGPVRRCQVYPNKIKTQEVSCDSSKFIVNMF